MCLSRCRPAGTEQLGNLYGLTLAAIGRAGCNLARGIRRDRPRFPPFDPESVENYEVGIKSTWLDNTLRVNAAFFSYEYDNLVFIAGECLPNSDQGSNQFEISDLEGEGVELSVTWAAADGLELWGNLGTLDAKYTDRQRGRVVDGQCDIVDESGEQFGSDEEGGSPEISYSLGANYTYNFSNGAETTASVSWAWQEGRKDRRSCKYVQGLGNLSAIYAPVLPTAPLLGIDEIHLACGVWICFTTFDGADLSIGHRQCTGNLSV